MLALVAGTGALPPAIISAFPDALVCALDGFTPDIPVALSFRLEHLGSFLAKLTDRGVTQVCFAGAVQRPSVDPAQIDAATLPLVPVIKAAMSKGDDGALRAIMQLFEAHGLQMVAAHDLVPELLPVAGVLTSAKPDADMMAEAVLGERVVAKLGNLDRGQACVIQGAKLLAEEGPGGTDAMLGSVRAQGGILYKAPKPNQDRRADLPVIGIGTAHAVIAAGLDGIVVTAGGVMVLDRDAVVAAMDAAGKVVWVRPETEG
ncbi:MAG: UDP-2,3-diacylglucosamine diphosphatase LpxI [Yoonia sp.]|nr:UDP-2,3-diacylglucosamine diphosphatase LpxI [Yoonia sp.]